jgi:hypothetical protein
VAELADARDLKSLGPQARTGSIPVSGTNTLHYVIRVEFYPDYFCFLCKFNVTDKGSDELSSFFYSGIVKCRPEVHKKSSQCININIVIGAIRLP